MRDYKDETPEECTTGVRSGRRGPTAVGTAVREAILGNATNSEVLAMVQARHPESTINERSVASIRSEMRRRRPDLPTSHDASRSRDMTVVAVVEAAILSGATNAAVVSAVLARFPASSITGATVSTYRNALKERGVSVLTDWEARKSVATVAQSTPQASGPRPAPSRPVQGAPTVASVAVAAIRAHATDAEALEAVIQAIPQARTTPDGIAFYRSKLRAAGEAVLKSSEVKRARLTAEPGPVY